MQINFIVCLFLLVAVAGQPHGPGGLGPTLDATKEIQDLINELKGEIKEEAGVNHCFKVFKAISYRSQVVSGLNYFVKIKVGKAINDYLHARLYVVPWLSRKEVSGVQINKFLLDPIEYF